MVFWIFIVFNLVMASVIVAGVGANIENTETMFSSEQIGDTIGTTIDTVGVLLAFWGAGDIILGLFALFTRKRRS